MSLGMGRESGVCFLIEPHFFINKSRYFSLDGILTILLENLRLCNHNIFYFKSFLIIL